MNIIEHDWPWRHGLSARRATDAIVLHHAAIKTASAEDIHRAHLQRDNGTWAGIGYHLYIRKNGEVHRGRPLWASGAHVLNHNWHTVGVCVEGNYDVETQMPPAQLQAVREALAYLKGVYPDAAIRCHRDLQATACPGRYYPYAAATEGIGRSRTPAPTQEYPVGGGVPDAPQNKNDREEDSMQRYQTVSELPEAYRADVQTLIDRGVLRGKGDQQHLDLTEDMARVLIVCARMEGVV